MYGLGLFGDTVFSKEGASKEISDSLNCLNKSLVRDLEVVVGLYIWSVCIVHAWISVDEGGVFVVDWELFWAHEEHMLQEMGQTQRAIGILKTSDSDWDWACAFL